MLGSLVSAQVLGSVVRFVAWVASDRVQLGAWEWLDVLVDGQDVSVKCLLFAESLRTTRVVTASEPLFCLMCLNMAS